MGAGSAGVGRVFGGLQAEREDFSDAGRGEQGIYFSSGIQKRHLYNQEEYVGISDHGCTYRRRIFKCGAYQGYYGGIHRECVSAGIYHRLYKASSGKQLRADHPGVPV